MDLYASYLEFLYANWLPIFVGGLILIPLADLAVKWRTRKYKELDSYPTRHWRRAIDATLVPGWYWWWQDHRTDAWEPEIVQIVEITAFGQTGLFMQRVGDDGCNIIPGSDWFFGPLQIGKMEKQDDR